MTKGVDWNPGTIWSKEKRKMIFGALASIQDDKAQMMAVWLKEKWKL